MQRQKLGLILVAVIAIGIFALPSTMAMFGGQHNWYDLGPSGNQVPCVKCHADVYDEYSVTGVHGALSYGIASNVTGPDPDAACDACHRVANATLTVASGDGSGSVPGQEAHAASTVACMECHGGDWGNLGTVGSRHYDKPEYLVCNDCHFAPPPALPLGSIDAGGFGLTPNPLDTGTAAAHKAFVDNSTLDLLMEDSNEACITCHTHVAIDINWTHRYKMAFTADSTSGEWVLSNFITEGDYNVTTYGNMSGGTTGATDPEVTISPTPPGYDPTNP